jgi:hypothetical protein
MGVALVAAGLAVGAPARGQYLPSTGGTAPMPEPLPCGPAPSAGPPQPNLIPGPVSPQVAPMGPPDCLSLSADSPSAFSCEPQWDDDHVYFNIGAQFLGRQRLGSLEVAARSPDVHPLFNIVEQHIDVTANDMAKVQMIYNGLPLFLRDAISKSSFMQKVQIGENVVDELQKNPFLPSLVPATAHSPVLQQLNNLVPRMNPGVRGTIGYMWGNDGESIEYTSFYIFQNHKSALKVDPSRVDELFYNPPAGFGGVGEILGNHGLWTDADFSRITYGSTFWNNEINYRRCNTGINGVELILGVRYVQENDSLDIDAGHFALRKLQANYGVATVNNIVAPQFGGEYTFPLTRWFTFGITGKGAWGANFIDSEVKLVRGDGLVGFDTTRAATTFSQIYDLGAFADVHILERLRLRLGFNAFWLLGIATAPDQVDFNLQGNQPSVLAQTLLGTNSNAPTLAQNLAQRYIQLQAEKALELNATRHEPHGHIENNGSILFFGPMVEFQFLF